MELLLLFVAFCRSLFGLVTIHVLVKLESEKILPEAAQKGDVVTVEAGVGNVRILEGPVLRAALDVELALE